ncbi:MAG: hypothetical protein ACYS6I_00725, partial [Planctomycetota bacterium]
MLVVMSRLRVRILVIVAGVLCIFMAPWGPAFAQPTTKEESMRQRVQWNLAIAEDQYQRGLYKETQQTLLKTQSEYDAYMTSEDRNKVGELLVQARMALGEREKIAGYLQASDELAANSQYLEAKSRLEAIKDNHFLTPDERQQVATAIKEFDRKLASYDKQVQGLFDESVKLYRAGQIEAARAGFAEVALSGTEIAPRARMAAEMIKGSELLSAAERNQIAASIQGLDKRPVSYEGQVRVLFDKSVGLYQAGRLEEALNGFVEVILSGEKIVVGGKTAQDYVRLIDEALVQPQPVPGVAPVAEPEDKADMGVEDMLFDMGTEEIPTEPDIPVIAPQEPEAVALTPSQPQVLLEPAVESQPQELEPVAPPQGGGAVGQGYIGIIEQKRRRQVSYIQAVVTDAEARAQQYLLANEFGRAKQALAAALSVINKNKLLLADELYRQYSERLRGLDEQITRHENDYYSQQLTQKQAETEQLRRQMRKTMEAQRAQAVKDYMDRAYAFSKEQRYDEALGQLEQLLAVEPLNNRALIYKKTLEDAVRWRKQLEIEKESRKEELALLIETGRLGIPFRGEYKLPRDWKELTAGRKEDVMVGISPADAVVYTQLDQKVDLSLLTETTSLSEAI